MMWFHGEDSQGGHVPEKKIEGQEKESNQSIKTNAIENRPRSSFWISSYNTIFHKLRAEM